MLLLLFCLGQLLTWGQGSFVSGELVDELPIKKLLNQSTPATSISDLRGKLVIVDFFGTWCAPCIRAMPHLKEIQEKFKEQVTVLLVSNETEQQLSKFIKSKKDFSFAVLVDEGNLWNDYFQPAALPYTVVIGKSGKMLATTEADQITDETIQQWLQTADKAAPSATLQAPAPKKATTMSRSQQSTNKTVQLSQQYIYAAKTGGETKLVFDALGALPHANLLNSLSTDDLKKAFWINVYNGFTQTKLKEDAKAFENRNSFFKKKQINIAGKLYSLDEIEHGILRRSKHKWSLGYISKLFPSKREKGLRVKEVDYRIHFALNCGAKSCPPIASYNDELLNQQLDLATRAYLSSEAEYDAQKNVVLLPKLMSWFRADFGGKKGMLRILKQHNLVPQEAKQKINFKEYDWTLSLNNYSN